MANKNLARQLLGLPAEETSLSDLIKNVSLLKGEQGIQGEPGEDGVDGITPVKGKDYFDGEDGIDGKDGKDGQDGKNGKKGEQGETGKDGKNGKNGKDGTEITFEDIKKKVESAKDDNRIDAKAIKGLEKLKEIDTLKSRFDMSDQRWHGGGASRFTQLQDVPSSYIGQSGKIVTVKTTEDGLQFSTLPGILPPETGNANKFLTTDGTSPSWSYVPLTTGVSGVLPILNGGTGTTTTFTQGSVIFAGASGVYSQDNANFNYSSSTKFFGLGTTAANPFHVLSSYGGVMSNFQSSNAAYGAQFGLDSTPGGGKSYILVATGHSNTNVTTDSFGIYDIAASKYRLVMTPAGNFGLDAPYPSYKLDVNGNIGNSQGALGLYSGGTNSDITYNPSGTGKNIFNSNPGANFVDGNVFYNNVANSSAAIASFLAPNTTAVGVSYGPYFTVGVAETAYNCGAVQFNYYGAGDTRNSLNLGIYGFTAPLYINKTNVGINIGNPLYPLHIIGDTNGAAVGPLVVVNTPSGTIGTALTLNASAVAGGKVFSFISTGAAASTGAGWFAVFNGTDTNYCFAVDGSGRYVASGNNILAPLGQVTIYTTLAARIGLNIKGSTSQTGQYVYIQDSSANHLMSFTSSGTLLIGSGTASVGSDKLEVGTTYKFGVLPDYGGSGEIPANTALVGSTSGNLFFQPSDSNGAAGAKVGAAYFNGTSVFSAWEYANVASGFGNLLLMKSGGTVTVGASAKISASNALEAVGGDFLIQDTEAAVIINSTTTSNGSYLLMQSNGTNIFSFQVGGTTGPTGISKQILMKNLISGGGINILTNAVSTPIARFGDNGFTTIGPQADWTTNATSTLQVVGSLSLPYIAKTANYTATSSDYEIDCTANTFTVLLPDSSASNPGRIYVITNSGLGIITYSTVGGVQIVGNDGVTTSDTILPGDSVTFHSTGTGYRIN